MALRFACLYLVGPHAMLVFSWAVLPDRAAADNEAPGLALLFTLGGAAGPDLCVAPWSGPVAEMPRHATEWPPRLKATRALEWAGAALVEPTLFTLGSAPMTHYVALDKPFIKG